MTLNLQIVPSVMELYHNADLIQALENALEVMESAGPHIVRDVDFVGWDYGTTKREEMPANIFLREGELAGFTLTLSLNSNCVQDWNHTSKVSQQTHTASTA